MIRKNALQHFTVNEIKPTGWLYTQLKIQAEGLSGNLDKIWPDVKDSSWIGGEHFDWERVPYWLDGFIPLAYELDDEDLKARAKKYIDGILSIQKEDGWMCPCTDEERGNYDIWAFFLISKVLVLYYECSGDGRIEEALYRAYKQFKGHITHCTIRNWGHSRWFEGLIGLYWLYERRPEDWMLELAVSIYSTGLNYKVLFDNWRDELPRNEWSYQTHVVNLAMAIKSEAIASRITNADPDEFAEKMVNMLFEHHGTAYGHFNGDECLSGTSPIQGSELCSVVEAMYSYEILFEITGNLKWIDRLERLAYNALPATVSEDMWTHQYDQMANQIACTRMEKPVFRTNNGEAHFFGLEPNYGCCTANFNQGWPKFALSTFYKSEKGIVSASLAPSKLTTDINGTKVTVELKTNYPFNDALTYTVTAEEDVEFDFGIRIPAFADCATVDGKACECSEIYNISRKWNKGENVITVSVKSAAKLINRPNNMVYLENGALLYVLPIEAEWKMNEYEAWGTERKFPYCDYELAPKSKWNYGFKGKNFEYKEGEISEHPFSEKNPPCYIYADMAEISWDFLEGYDNVCAQTPNSNKAIGEVKRIKLIPYGCSKLRITETYEVE